MDDLAQLLRVTPAAEIARKWNVTDDRLNEIVKRHKLPLYFIREKRIRPNDGKTIYFCAGPSFQFYYDGDFPYGYYVLDDIYFNTDTVEAFEVSHPEILWEPACPDEDLAKEYGEYIPADVIRRKLEMSPMQFINLMNSGEGPISSWEENFTSYKQSLYSDGEFFSTKNLKDETFTFHIIDWRTWQEARKKVVMTTSVTFQDATGNNEDTANILLEKDACIVKLEHALTEAREKIAELTTTTRTQAATQARQGKALAEWQKAFKVMLPVVLQCQAEGEKARTRADLDRMCGARKLTSAQMDFLRECLRECLGPEYVNTTGGPTIQG